MPTRSPAIPPLLDVADLADQLRPVMLKLSRHLRREALKVGLSDLDAQLLGIVKRKPGLGVSELADIEHMSRPTMSAHVKRLDEAGWLKREAENSDGDRRRVRLLLTPEGTHALEAIRRSRNDWLEARLGRLSGEEFAALDAALGSLVRLAEMKN